MNFFHSLDPKEDFRNTVDYDSVAHKQKGAASPQRPVLPSNKLATIETTKLALGKSEYNMLIPGQSAAAGEGGDDDDLNKGRKRKSGHEEEGRPPKKQRSSKSWGSGELVLKNKSIATLESPSFTSTQMYHESSHDRTTHGDNGTPLPLDFNKQYAAFEFDAGEKTIRVRVAKPMASKFKMVIMATNVSFQETALDVDKIASNIEVNKQTLVEVESFFNKEINEWKDHAIKESSDASMELEEVVEDEDSFIFKRDQSWQGLEKLLKLKAIMDEILSLMKQQILKSRIFGLWRDNQFILKDRCKEIVNSEKNEALRSLTDVHHGNKLFLLRN
eukprot:Gb_15122 [translate_table: standard]